MYLNEDLKAELAIDITHYSIIPFAVDSFAPFPILQFHAIGSLPLINAVKYDSVYAWTVIMFKIFGIE